MAFSAKILADSICSGISRLTTFEITYPRCVHAELMTHRVFSRNSASSRAIPVEKMLRQIVDDPFIPIDWGKNQRGMQAGESLPEDVIADSKRTWLEARNVAVEYAGILSENGLHKQIVNRIVEPWMWITVIVSATEYENWFKLRCHDAAEPHIRRIAEMMRELYRAAEPARLLPGEWHLPLFGFAGDEAIDEEDKPKVSVGRCARVSYLTHDGNRDPYADVELCNKLRESGHWSPFEHVAQAKPDAEGTSGNFGKGWIQYRKTFFGESGRNAP